MDLLNRKSLKELFKNGKSPTETNFSQLIDSSVNKVEDGIASTPTTGLQLSPQGNFDRVLSVYERVDLPLPAWQIRLLKDSQASGLSFERSIRNENNEPTTESQLFLGNNGNIGVKTSSPETTFHINGTAGIKTRVGVYRRGEVPGDGEWHNILEELDGPRALEVVAKIDGPSGRGKYAITHAIALSTFGGKHSRNRIRQTRSYYGWFTNRIELRWHGETFDYTLQVRTRKHYGFDDDKKLSMIRFHISGLWDDDLFKKGETD